MVLQRCSPHGVLPPGPHYSLPACPRPPPLPRLSRQSDPSADSETAACNLSGNVTDCCEWGSAAWGGGGGEGTGGGKLLH